MASSSIVSGNNFIIANLYAQIDQQSSIIRTLTPFPRFDNLFSNQLSYLILSFLFIGQLEQSNSKIFFFFFFFFNNFSILIRINKSFRYLLDQVFG